MGKRDSHVYRSGGTRGGHDQFKWEDVKTDKVFLFVLKIAICHKGII